MSSCLQAQKPTSWWFSNVPDYDPRVSHRTRVSAMVIAGAAIVGAAALVAARGGTTPQRVPSASENVVAPGRAFSADTGSPVDVDVERGEGNSLCIAISGDPYLSSSLCSTQSAIEERGAYTIAAPVEGNGAVLVVGLVPVGARRVLVTTRGATTLGALSGRVFLAKLPSGALDATGEEAVSVRFD